MCKLSVAQKIVVAGLEESRRTKRRTRNKQTIFNRLTNRRAIFVYEHHFLLAFERCCRSDARARLCAQLALSRLLAVEHGAAAAVRPLAHTAIAYARRVLRAKISQDADRS